MSEELDENIRDNILKPASTRSKIVVNLREPKGPDGKKRAWRSDDPVEYDLDPYDKVRMRLLKEDEMLYNAYLKTIDTLQNTRKYQPKKVKMNIICWLITWFFMIVFLLAIVYASLLIIQLSLFNLVIVGIIFMSIVKFWQIMNAIRWKFEYGQKTKDFNAYIKEQNDSVYAGMNIQIIAEREGLWLEFLLKEEEAMFEDMIAKRRKEILEMPNNEE